ncbi:hypothetical protein D7027_17330 [Ochrobactrum intermedium]|nr:hypothetical protein [Brucella intermedia]
MQTDHTANGKYEVSTIGDGMTEMGVGSCWTVKRFISVIQITTRNSQKQANVLPFLNGQAKF